jgi:hypothetical protein
MASRYFVNGGVDNLYATTGNWSATSGGAGGAGVPAVGDDVFFDANSPNMTAMGANRQISSIDFTGYTNTFTLDQNLQVTGTSGSIFNAVFVSGMTLDGTGTLTMGASRSLTTAGKTIPTLVFNTAGTTTLNDDVTVSTQLTLTTSASNPTLNGNTIYCQGNLVHNGSSAVISGTTNIVMSGTGTVSGSSTSGRIANNFTINTSGTITFSGICRFGGGTFTYTAGTVVTTGSTIFFSSTETINAAGVIWDAMTFTGAVTYTLSAHLHLTGILTIGATTSTTVINGFQINVMGGLVYNGTSALTNGTTILHLVGTQTITAPSRTTGYCAFTLHLDAPGGTITISSGFVSDIHDLNMSLGTTITTTLGSFTVGTAGNGIGWVN